MPEKSRKDSAVVKEARKKGVNGRTKGATFERDIARDLRAWLGAGWDVSRTPTDRQRAQDRSGHAGEFTIVPPDGSWFRFRWAIECKNSAAFDLRQLWRKPIDGPLPGWWAQAVKQAEAVGRSPLLIVKVARGETLAIGHVYWMPPGLYVNIGADTVIASRWSDMKDWLMGPPVIA